jgi:cytochrome c-type biogenesis protein CcmH/NrfG
MSTPQDELKAELAVIREAVTELKVDTAKQTVILQGVERNLGEHMRRTSAAEGRLEVVERFFQRAAGAWTFLGAVAVLLGIAVSIGKLLGKI